MALEKEKSTSKQQDAKADLANGGADESGVSEPRRKAIKAGLIGTPLIFTLRSASAWDGEPDGNTSRLSPTHTAQPSSRLDPVPPDDQGADG